MLVFSFFCKLFCGGLISIVIVLDVWNLANAFHCGEKLVILMRVLGCCKVMELWKNNYLRSVRMFFVATKYHILICVK